jgi:hypothetical protein
MYCDPLVVKSGAADRSHNDEERLTGDIGVSAATQPRRRGGGRRGRTCRTSACSHLAGARTPRGRRKIATPALARHVQRVADDMLRDGIVYEASRRPPEFPLHCVQSRCRGSQRGPGRVLPSDLSRKPSRRFVGPFSREATCSGSPWRARARMERWRLPTFGSRRRCASEPKETGRDPTASLDSPAGTWMITHDDRDLVLL